ncbi:hypothetical protein N658DRAFT_282064 [Parathielavia hyrcaniae]|uniref:Uncharacterized protein n=1 Tax=Parathielavia hyrcaniae TaxID=113614 RepID=A0AAN6T4E2_9PEZI|nr:hypothetical protein N658DRAFT_282064 [Parathielavia hyrcaniae]
MRRQPCSFQRSGSPGPERAWDEILSRWDDALLIARSLGSKSPPQACTVHNTYFQGYPDLSRRARRRCLFPSCGVHSIDTCAFKAQLSPMANGWQSTTRCGGAAAIVQVGFISYGSVQLYRHFRRPDIIRSGSPRPQTKARLSGGGKTLCFEYLTGIIHTPRPDSPTSPSKAKLDQ